MLSKNDITSYIDRYNERLEKYGDDPKTLGWGGGSDRQNIRFITALQSASLKNYNLGSILDYGCGLGHLYGFLESNDAQVEYFGVDINSKLVTLAQNKYPNTKFLVTEDLTKSSIDFTPDLCIANGVFSAAIKDMDQLDYIQKSISALFDLSTFCVSIDFMTDRVDFQADGAFHLAPEQAYAIGKSISDNVVLRDDYLEYEYMMYVYK